MKTKLILLSALLLIGCGKVNIKENQTDYAISGKIHNLDILIIDNCEYLYGDWGNATVLTHKGNCKNHKINKDENK